MGNAPNQTTTLAPTPPAAQGAQTALAAPERAKRFVAAMEEQVTRQKQRLTVLLQGSDQSFERFAKIMMSTLVRDPKLQECTAASIINACLQSAELGMSLGVQGHGYLVPFNKNVAAKNAPAKWEKQAQFIPGYKGMIHVAQAKGGIRIRSFAVHEGDDFSYELGMDPTLRHIPAKDYKKRGEFCAAYATAKYPDGYTEFLVMWKDEIDDVKNRAADNKKNPVWDTDYIQMALKTVVRRMWKTMPLPSSMQDIAERLEEVEGDNEGYRPSPALAGIPEPLAALTEGNEIDTPDEPAPHEVEHVKGSHVQGPVVMDAQGVIQHGARRPLTPEEQREVMSPEATTPTTATTAEAQAPQAEQGKLEETL